MKCLKCWTSKSSAISHWLQWLMFCVACSTRLQQKTSIDPPLETSTLLMKTYHKPTQITLTDRGVPHPNGTQFFHFCRFWPKVSVLEIGAPLRHIVHRPWTRFYFKWIIQISAKELLSVFRWRSILTGNSWCSGISFSIFFSKKESTNHGPFPSERHETCHGNVPISSRIFACILYIFATDAIKSVR